MWRPHLFRLGCPGVTITRVASAVARELAARIFFHDRMTRQWRDFSPLSGSGYSGSGGPCCQLWHAASEQPVNAHMPACQSYGADLPPANLSCPGV